MDSSVEEINIIKYPNPHKKDLESIIDLSWRFLKKGSYGAARFYSSFVMESIDDVYGVNKIDGKILNMYTCAKGVLNICDDIITSEVFLIHPISNYSNPNLIRGVLEESSNNWILDANLRKFYEISKGSIGNFLPLYKYNKDKSNQDIDTPNDSDDSDDIDLDDLDDRYNKDDFGEEGLF